MTESETKSVSRPKAESLPTSTGNPNEKHQLDWLRLGALIVMHGACLGVFFVGWSWTAVLLAALLYLARAFGLTAFYHRYFAHRAFKTSRWFQFAGALLGTLALQKGPLWWAAHHREHHRRSDRSGDVHSPHVDGFWWSHIGWIVSKKNNAVRSQVIRDWLKFPELRWLDRNAPMVAVIYGVALFGLGEFLRWKMPALRTDGWMLLVWAFFVSTVVLYHATYCVNSLAHLFGSRVWPTADDSRNNLLVAILTLGEGWHNNHHYYPTSARQGFFWWEIDLTYYLLFCLEQLGIVWDLRQVPAEVLNRRSSLKSAARLQARE